MLVGDRAEADRLDLAPGGDRDGEGVARTLEAASAEGSWHSVSTDCFSASGAVGKLGVTRPDVLLERRLGDGRVIRLGLRRSS